MTLPDLEKPDDALAALRRDYLRDAPERLAELRKDLAAFRAGEPDALESLRQRFHRLAGSGGSYGFPRVTVVAREMEHRILTPPVPTAQEGDRFDQAILDLRAAFDEAATDLDMPMVLGRLPGFAYRALVVMHDEPIREVIADALRKVGFELDIQEGNVDPWDVPPSRRPDLVVIGTNIGDEALVLARYWAAATPERPRAVVLADTVERFDRLRTAAAGLDAVFGMAQLPAELALFARGLARVGAPPPNVVVVEDDPAQAQLLATWLSELNARVALCSSAQAAADTLSRELPDLVLLDVDLPDVDGYAIARLIRQDPRLTLVPIVFLTARRTLADEMEGLRAGGDDFLAKPVERSHLLQVVLTRGERGRRIRELVHRDGLTGVLNHSTLMAELEYAIAFATRHREPLCFLMLDIDHFKRVNDTHGHLTGDQVLVHVANVFRKLIRQSDLLGRYGGEEFGIILRRCPPSNAHAIADKLRLALASTPAKLANGIEVSPRVSIGIATVAGDGEPSVTDVTSAADRALYRAKASGRDRVEMG
ncbi:MAG TPA: diguanylate cyclase [Gemmatimonadales bacterium]|jgi:diguanylate cyclase (GGDEF)-like protein